MSRIVPRPLTPSTPVLRDRAYLDWLRTQPCIITGHRGTEHESVDPMHIGTLGKGIKSPDNEALPVGHSLHARAHQVGEVTFFRQNAPDWLIREAMRAYAREMYRRERE